MQFFRRCALFVHKYVNVKITVIDLINYLLMLLSITTENNWKTQQLSWLVMYVTLLFAHSSLTHTFALSIRRKKIIKLLLHILTQKAIKLIKYLPSVITMCLAAHSQTSPWVKNDPFGRSSVNGDHVFCKKLWNKKLINSRGETK